MKKSSTFCISILIMFLLSGCASIRYVPVQQIDTLIVKETLRDTLVLTELKTEVKEIYTQDTISALETSYARSIAKIERGSLYHKLENKDSVKIKIVYKDKLVEKTTIKEVPVEVEKEVKVIPSWCWWCLGFSILCVLLIFLRIYALIRGK